jgi:phosphopantetheinyl transferase
MHHLWIGERMPEGLSRVRWQDVPLERGCSRAFVVRACARPRDAERRHAFGAVLRSLLASLSGQAPGSVRIEAAAQGKPVLVGSAVAFNLSHARSYSLIALSLVGDVGCDIEDRFAKEDVMALCAPVLHPSELAAMHRLAPTERQDAFRRYWVRKEAVLKAAGSGFLRDPREVITGLEQSQPTWVGSPGLPFNIHNQQIDAGCVAAVASLDAACTWHLLED